MARPRVLLLEDDPAEATLAESALLFAGAEVVASPERAAVAVLGRKALREHADKLRIPAVAILAEPTDEERAQAEKLGVRAVYERPATWQAYTALVGRALADWLPTRKD
jgi:hypothetical protein